MSVATNPFSPMGEMLRCARDVLVATEPNPGAPNAVTITIGKRPSVYEGAPPRVHFRPDRGTWADSSIGFGGTGCVADNLMGCTVYVWGDGNADDWYHYDAADALTLRVLNALARVARGRISGGTFEDPAKANEEYFGQTYAIRFSYSYGIQRDKDIWSLPSNPIAASPPDLSRPPGSPASTVATSITVTPKP